MKPFQIDTSRVFPTLPNAPITEAVIQVIATPTGTLQDLNQDDLKAEFENYTVQSQTGFIHEMDAGSGGFQFQTMPWWNGFRLTSANEKYVCQIRPTTIIFSRLKPYEGWASFSGEFRKFQQKFTEWISPNVYDRIGVRFISQIELGNQSPADFIEMPPESLKSIGLASSGFFDSDTYETPGAPYKLTVTRTVEPPQTKTMPRMLIVDIDITTISSTPLDLLESRLEEMRYIKNEVFFSLMKDPQVKFA